MEEDGVGDISLASTSLLPDMTFSLEASNTSLLNDSLKKSRAFGRVPVSRLRKKKKSKLNLCE